MAYISNERIREAREQLDKIRSDRLLMSEILRQEIAEMDENARIEREKESREKEVAEGIAKGIAKGIAEGRAEGRAEGERITNINNAKKMKAEGISNEIITKITGLSPEEIEAL